MHEVKKFSEAYLFGRSFQISLALLRIKAYFHTFFEYFQGNNNSVNTLEHSSCDISGRNSTDRENSNGKLTSKNIFPLSESGFCFKFTNICSRPDIVFGPKNRDENSLTALALTEEQMEQTTLKNQNFLTHFKTTFLKITKLVVLIL